VGGEAEVSDTRPLTSIRPGSIFVGVKVVEVRKVVAVSLLAVALLLVNVFLSLSLVVDHAR